MNRRIRISVNRPVLAPTSDLLHTGTSYQISSKLDFDNPDNIIFESINNTDNLTEIYATIDSSLHRNVFIRTRYHFTKGSEIIDDNWSRVISANSKQEGYKISNVMIDTPVISYTTNGSDITITTSEFSMYYGPGSHKSTSWRVRDSNNVIIFERAYDEDNKTSILLHGLIEQGKSYILEAKHHNEINADSNWGKLPMLNSTDNYSLFDLELIGDITLNRKQYFKLKLFTTSFYSLDIEVRNIRGEVINSLYDTRALVNYITMSNMYVNSYYEIYARIKFTDKSTTEYRKVYGNLLKDNTTVRYNPFIKYLGKYTKSNSYLTDGIGANIGEELVDGNLIFTDFFTDTLTLYRFNGGDLVKLKELVKLEDDIKIEYVNVKQLRNNDIIVNYMTTDEHNYKQSVFKIFEYNPIKYELTLRHHIVRPYERYSTAISNSMVIDKNNQVYYIPAAEIDANGKDIPLSLYRINPVNGTVTKMRELVGSPIRNATIVADINDLMYIMGGSLDIHTINENDMTWKRDIETIYLYNPSTNGMTPHRSLEGIISKDVYCLQPMLKRDGGILIMNAVHNGPEVGNNDVVLYDVYNDTIELSNIDNDYNVPFRSFIIKQSGDVVRVSALEKDPQVSMIYVCNTIKLDEVVEVDEIEATQHLVVHAGEKIVIESPYRYESIVIEEGGTLVWMDRDKARTFTGDTYIATRSHIITQDEWEDGDYGSLLVLDGVSFIVRS